METHKKMVMVKIPQLKLTGEQVEATAQDQQSQVGAYITAFRPEKKQTSTNANWKKKGSAGWKVVWTERKFCEAIWKVEISH